MDQWTSFLILPNSSFKVDYQLYTTATYKVNILSVTYYTFTGIVFIFILLGIIGKFGLFPLNLGIFGIVDGVSLFTSMVVLLLNKFIYVIIVDYLPLGRLGNYVINDITFT